MGILGGWSPENGNFSVNQTSDIACAFVRV